MSEEGVKETMLGSRSIVALNSGMTLRSSRFIFVSTNLARFEVWLV